PSDAHSTVVRLDLDEHRFDSILALSDLRKMRRTLGSEPRVEVYRADQPFLPELARELHRARHLVQAHIGDPHCRLHGATPPSRRGSDAPRNDPSASITIS